MLFRWLYLSCDRLRNRARRRRWTVEMAGGRRGEDLAHRFLESRGYRIVARNYRGAGGEIDLVAWDGAVLVFVEVKSRSSEDYGLPDRAVDTAKRGHVARAARDYARRAGVPFEQARFDIVNVLLGRTPKLDLIRDAFGAGRTSHFGTRSGETI